SIYCAAIAYTCFSIFSFYIVYFIFVLHGVGTLMPWNMFINAESYFSEYKLNVTEASQEYSKNFLSYFGIAAQLPNIIFNGLNLFIQTKGDSLTLRITITLIIEVLIFLLTICFAIVDTSTWPGAFFYLTMASVVVLNMANGVYQNCVYGAAANLPMKYSNAVVLGSNTSGTLTSVINLITIAVSPNIRTAAIYYFLTALLVLLLCFDTYFALPLCLFTLQKFYAFYAQLHSQEKSRNNHGSPPYLKILRETWPQLLNVFLIFFVTLTIFPAVHANISPLSYETSILPKVYYTPVTCFFVFNFFAMLGNIVPNWITFPGPKYLWIPVVMRFLFFPFFFFCNYNAEYRKWPVYITNDYVYITGGVLLGFTSGYFSSLGMMYAPRCVQPEYAGVAGMMAAFVLICGIFLGVNFSLVFSWLSETKIF
ncbi:equilibrative nucleoside transporter 3-like isoform X2, partial [Dinothrombium tinctorium]